MVGFECVTSQPQVLSSQGGWGICATVNVFSHDLFVYSKETMIHNQNMLVFYLKNKSIRTLISIIPFLPNIFLIKHTLKYFCSMITKGSFKENGFQLNKCIYYRTYVLCAFVSKKMKNVLFVQDQCFAKHIPANSTPVIIQGQGYIGLV